MRWFIDMCHLIALVVIAPFLLYRAVTTGKYRRDWDQRTGRMPWLPCAGEGNPRVWVHAVSVGEINAVRGLISAWQARSPRTQFVISTTTDTGMDRARQIFPDLTIIRYPLDLSWWVSRALDRIAPTMIVLVELEVWFHFVTTAAARGIPIAVVNGRLSERSARRFGWIRPVAKRMFRSLAWVGAQDQAYAGRFRALGVKAERVSVTGSLKWDTAEITQNITGTDELARAMGIDRTRPLWVCGSTGPGEEEVILQAFKALRDRSGTLYTPQLAIVPRKPERFDEVAELIRRHGFVCIRRTQAEPNPARQCGARPTTGVVGSETAVQLVDTMGELRKCYMLADVVFVGRTLARMGGSDMMEVAALGKPIVVGPHTENFADAMQQLLASQAVVRIDADLEAADVADTLAKSIYRLLEDREEAQRMAERACEVVKKNRGATERTLSHLTAILNSRMRPDAGILAHVTCSLNADP